MYSYVKAWGGQKPDSSVFFGCSPTQVCFFFKWRLSPSPEFTNGARQIFSELQSYDCLRFLPAQVCSVFMWVPRIWTQLPIFSQPILYQLSHLSSPGLWLHYLCVIPLISVNPSLVIHRSLLLIFHWEGIKNPSIHPLEDFWSVSNFKLLCIEWKKCFPWT